MVQGDSTSFIGMILNSSKFMKNSLRIMFEVLKDQRVKDLYENKDNKFDLVISGYFVNNYQFGLAHKLKAPLIISFSAQPFGLLNTLVGNPLELSYVPAMYTVVKTGETMTFGQRLYTFILTAVQTVWFAVYDWENERRYLELYGDDPSMPKYVDLNKNISLMFIATHGLSEGPIRPNVPAFVEIGGIQVKDKPDPLPKDIEQFLNNATDGAILLSLGSNVKGAHLNPEIVQNMFKVLSNLKQNVLWKWENLEETPGESSNILYSKWLPQDDILAHPNIKLFITHAGKGGVVESQYHGKPMLALPVFADQPTNAQTIVSQGFGLSLKLLELQADEFHKAIVELLENPKYTTSVQTFSKLFRDRPLTARQTVLYWSEYVIRHHGAKHIQSPLVHMDFISANNLDIFALFLLISLISLWLTKIVLIFAVRRFKSKSSLLAKITKVKTK
ncbi:UDP-glycosyltransferase UGT5-like [Drosophila tropicalis]|uniref:UDP-glycosyltransferase UGT5-like n=1 Tax=Drosophila tropicalis TaxID=46794 RepID=UPI0035ABA74C